MRARCVSVCVALFAATAGAARAQVLVHGRVIDAGTGAPVVGAEIASSGVHAVSGEDGTWRITLPRGEHELIVKHVAFADAVVDVDVDIPDAADITIRLTPRPVALNELVVTASRRVQQLKDVPVATEVVAREEIERTGAADLSAVLVERTGISVEGGHPVGTGIMLQGLGS